MQPQPVRPYVLARETDQKEATEACRRTRERCGGSDPTTGKWSTRGGQRLGLYLARARPDAPDRRLGGSGHGGGARFAARGGLLVGSLAAVALLYYWPFDPASAAHCALTVAAGAAGGVLGVLRVGMRAFAIS